MRPDGLRSSRILVPALDHLLLPAVVEFAAALAGGAANEVTVLDVVEEPSERDISARALAVRSARERLAASLGTQSVHAHPVVRIDRSFAEGVAAAAAEMDADLVLVSWSGEAPARAARRRTAEAIVRAVARAGSAHSAMLRLRADSPPDRILVAVRGGPHAELALAAAAAFSASTGAPIVVLHIVPPGMTRAARAASERALMAVARAAIPGEVVQFVREAADVASAILAEARPTDMIMLGATVTPEGAGLRPMRRAAIPDRVVRAAPCSALVLRTREKVISATFDELAARPGTLASVDRAAEALRDLPARVDRWFGESNFHHAEYADLERLAGLKERRGLTVSLVLPALNEAETIGPIVARARRDLMERVPLVDELLVIDSASTDDTVRIAQDAGARVVLHPGVLARYGSYRGKGEALWKSLFETSGDIVAWCDTDVKDWSSRMAYGTIGPLLEEPRLQYVKGYYQRPIVEGGVLREGGGGRVTELVARPLINLFFPELSGFIQPLAGEYAGRRELLESIPFFTGYAVEIGHLVDALDRVGLDGLGQVDLDRRVHRNQELEGLSRMSFVILQAVMRRLEERHRARLFAELGSRMKLPRSGQDELRLEVIELADHERPPMIRIPEYLERRQSPEPVRLEVALVSRDGGAAIAV